MHIRTPCLLFLVWGLFTTIASAGMPAPLPTDIETVLRVNDSAYARLQVISFFLVGLLFATGVVRFLWNFLQRDFPKMPRLTFGRALAGVLLWGLLFVIVLTMISGARELMTPGAWKKQGFTYKLADTESAKEKESPRSENTLTEKPKGDRP